MMSFFNELVVKWHVDRLSALISVGQTALVRNNSGYVQIIKDHLSFADASLDDAISALKYGKFAQAEIACQNGLLHVGLAQGLSQQSVSKENIVDKNASINASRKLNEADELVSYLASALAEMKVVIEYSSLQIGSRAQSTLDRSMDFYNDAISALKSGDSIVAKRSAQAGLLHLLFASEVVSQDNHTRLPGWRALSNPMLVSPLRRGNELVSALIEIRGLLNFSPNHDFSLSRSHYDKALKEYNSTLDSLAKDNLRHAYLTIDKAFRELELARQLTGLNELSSGNMDLKQAVSRTPIADVESLVAEIKAVLSVLPITRKEIMYKRLESVEVEYKNAVNAHNKNNNSEAIKSAANALLELDFVRQVVFRKNY